ncbi:beta-ketoacyl synthase chain length factor [Piscinibacter sakaiensis]|uniref:beta-ketoacyl synthase chain length factor n=1 Tax=Piscinibacter sakaiensis TaxID=1547922 RepID=UPI0006B4ED02|nr:beta-ketoacyl synthase chain length factor [Piscinibacter sakaiensis]
MQTPSAPGATPFPGLAVRVAGIGLLGPGLPDWARGAALLREPSAWTLAPTVVPPPARLPATERRRAGAVVKLALAVADEALAAAGADPRALPTVFASSTGDPANCHALCEALAQPQRLVSPTRFTNSVHNAPAGYWHIATQSMQASTSLGAYDASVAAALLEAAAQVVEHGRPVLMVASDVPYPEPLHAKRPVLDSLGLALVLVPEAQAGAGPRLRLRPAGARAPSPCAGAATGEGLDVLRTGIPAGRALPLLQALAALAGEAAAAGPVAETIVEGPPGAALSIAVDGP